MKVGVDLMGGDFAPQYVLEGAMMACSELKENDSIILTGDINLVNSKYTALVNELSKTGKVFFVDYPEVIEMCDSPTKAFTQKPRSSMAGGFRMLKSGETDVFMGAGNSGAMLVGAINSVKVIEGVIRPAITSFVPRENGKFGIIIDIGINPDARYDVLFQFGLLASLYLKNVSKIENPRVALLNIGSEKEKGNLATQAAYSMMEGSDKYNFIGNIEGYDVLTDKADVIVCDGFTGNIVIKTIEGLYQIAKKRNLTDPFFKSFNYEIYGGTPILGINKPVLVGHGNSSPLAFKNMISLGMKIVESNLITQIKNQIINLNNYQ